MPKLKDIKGLLLRKNTFTVQDRIKRGSDYINKIIWENRTIDKQGEIELVIDVKKVEKTLVDNSYLSPWSRKQIAQAISKAFPVKMVEK